MKYLTIFLCCVATVFGNGHIFSEHFPLRLDGRVVGGKEADPHSAPYIVSLKQNDRLHCGASIIAKDWILTAAHCLTLSPKSYSVIAGIHNVNLYGHSAQQRQVDYYSVHEKYGGGVGPFDIGIAHVFKPFEFNAQVHPISLPEAEKIHSGQVTLFGWGSISKSFYPEYPDELQFVNKPIVDYETCFRVLGPSGSKLHRNNVCTGPLSGGVSACSGDSGGPLVQKNEKKNVLELVGIVSWGRIPCGGVNNPSVYTRVSAYNDWIKHNQDMFYMKRFINY